jgi:hypothetical protein
MPDATATLLSKKSTRVTRQQLRGIETPLSTPTHRPVPHADLVDMLEDRLNASGLFIFREQYAVQSHGQKLFGTLDLHNGGASAGEGTTLALGFRHGNDKSMALKCVGGCRVTICDNMAMMGDTTVFRLMHKHGVMAGLRERLSRYFGEYDKQVASIKDRIEAWRWAGLTDIEAKATVYDAVTTGVIPSRLLGDIDTAYFRATDLGYTDCEPRSKWGLHNAFTRSFKSLNPAPEWAAQTGLTRLLG